MTRRPVGMALAAGAFLSLVAACQNFPEPAPGYAKPASKTASSEAGQSGAETSTPTIRRRAPPAPEYSASYKRDPNRPSPAKARAQAERDFEKMVNPKVLEMLRLLNAERRKNGLSTVVLEPRLMAAALRESKDMAKYGHLSHTGSDGSHMEDRIADVQYYYTKIAENIAASRATAAATFQQWVVSKEHYKQMMITSATQAGIAYAYNPNPPSGGLRLYHYWTLLIGRPHPFHE